MDKYKNLNKLSDKSFKRIIGSMFYFNIFHKFIIP